MMRRGMVFLAAAVLGWAGGAVPCVRAAETVTDLLAGDPAANYGWTFNNGQEFPGATGRLSVDAAETRDGRASLKLEGDFTKGGNYVSAELQLDDPEVSEISFQLKCANRSQLTMRIGDSSGQCHQINLKIANTPDWQKVFFQLGSFLAEKGNSPAAEMVKRYENWGGAKDNRWHGPAKYITILIGPDRGAGDLKPALWVNQFKLTAKDPAAAGGTTTVRKTVRLDEFPDGELDWTFGLGDGKGAQGGMTLVKDGFAPGRPAIKIAADFTKGGIYVAATRNLKNDDNNNVTVFRMKMKAAPASSFSVQVVDATGQCHQKKGLPLAGDGQWHDVVIKPESIAGGEHWGGANDGKWHGPVNALSIILGAGADPGKQPVLWIADISADVLVQASVQPASFNADFENLTALPDTWEKRGNVTLDAAAPFKGKASLRLERTEKEIDNATSVVTAAFPVKEGLWELGAATRADLYSPDSSYNGGITLELLGGNGGVLSSLEFSLTTGKAGWKPVKKTVDIPRGAAFARFRIQLNKTFGVFGVDDLTAAYVAASPKANSIFSAIKFSSSAAGNLFYPGTAPVFGVAVETVKPWVAETREISCVVTDYWGAEQGAPVKVKLEKAGKTGKGKFQYKGALDLAAAAFEPGKYYEIHAEAAMDGAPALREKSTFAFLPKAVTKNYRPVEIPFTGRDWDNRVKERFILSDRLGIRWCGIWSGWDPKPPYKPHAPGIELCKELDMGAVLGTPASAVEGHNGNYKDYTETAFREGAKALVGKYKDYVPLMITMGNEPHGGLERAKEDVAAYKPVYEGAKQADPNILVIGTSCGPDEDFFKAGFQPYQDVYDFHLYEDPRDIRKAFKKYRDLFAAYGQPKPIWSTEIGLNSQGMTRIAITRDLIKKFAIFFAEGGVSMNWFDLLYPDPDGTRPGTNSESFDVFYSKYSMYCPKLDAIAYYNMVNGICIKKFVQEKIYDGEIDAVLFRDKENRCLLVLWKEKGREDVFLPLKGVGKTRLIRIDGSSAELDAKGRGLTLTASEDPVLLLFDAADLKLADKLGTPAVAVQGAIPAVIKGGRTTLSFSVDGVGRNGLALTAPPAWTVQNADGSSPKTAAFSVSAPETTGAREGRLVLSLKDGSGELSVPMPISGKLSLRVVPVPLDKNGAGGVKLVVRNNSSEKDEVSWNLAVPSAASMAGGNFALSKMETFTPSFTSPTEGKIVLDGKSEKEIVVGVANFAPLTIYKAVAGVTDGAGKSLVRERYVSGFVGVPKVKTPVAGDGMPASGDWARAQLLPLDNERQVFYIGKKPDNAWKGPADLSGQLRVLWDDRALYLNVDVRDDKYVHALADSAIWNMDGMQILVDAARESVEKSGKYEISLADGAKGPQAWCNYSADASTPTGEVKDIRIKVTPAADGTGGRRYEIAIPWPRLAPFKPGVGEDLGFSLILNEDDGPGRSSFMGWFSGVHSKELDLVGDLILLE